MSESDPVSGGFNFLRPSFPQFLASFPEFSQKFTVIWLDNRHRILNCETLFTGTIDGASVHPREVIRAALNINAAACILSHNHPSGVAEPSSADRAITKELRDALSLVGVRVLTTLWSALVRRSAWQGEGSCEPSGHYLK